VWGSASAAYTGRRLAGLVIGQDTGRVWAWLAGATGVLGVLLAPIGTARAKRAAEA